MRAALGALAMVLLGAAPAAPAAGPAEPPPTPPPARPLGEPMGFAAGTTGGAGGGERWVTSLADAGPGTLREALARPGPQRVRFAVAGELRLRTPVSVPSDTTVDGSDAEVTVTNKGLRVAGAANVVLTDLRIAHIRGEHDDAVQIVDGARGVWVDHCDLADGSDGLLDITRGATDVTVSWTRFRDHVKVMAINTERDRGTPARVTLHHNLFDGTDQRHPLVRNATVHAFNNVLRDWGSYGMQSGAGGELYSQANVFLAGEDESALLPEGRAARRGPGALRSHADLLLGGAEAEQRGADEVFVPPYAVPVEPAAPELVERVAAQAGPRPPSGPQAASSSLPAAAPEVPDSAAPAPRSSARPTWGGWPTALAAGALLLVVVLLGVVRSTRTR